MSEGRRAKGGGRGVCLLLSLIALLPSPFILLNCSSSHTLQLISDQGIAALPSEHEVVVLNFWATWCEPCVEEIPILIRLQEQRKDVRVIGVSMDEPGNEALVRHFIHEHHMTYTIVLRKGGEEENFETMVNSIDPEWIGGLPATFVFRDGKRIFSKAGQISERELLQAVS